MQHTPWLERTFPSMMDTGLLPGLLERLQGTPVRIEELVRQADPVWLSFKPAKRWSVKEEIGHLGDLEPLWLARVHNFMAGDPVLAAADMSNAKTHEAGHQEKETGLLLKQFREQRMKLVASVRRMNKEQQERTARHPRLQQNMRIVDLAYFVAEHDDHHLARMRELVELADS